MKLLWLAVLLFGAAAADPTNVEYYKELFWPHRHVIRESFRNIILDRDPPRQIGVADSRADFLTCPVCRLAFPMMQAFLAENVEKEEIIQTITTLCVSLGIESKELCAPTIRAYADPVLHILEARPNYKTADLCGIINRNCGQPNASFVDWDVKIDGAQPPPLERPPVPAGTPAVKILQLTDIHLDLDYIVGKNANCDKPVCCREMDGEPAVPEDAGGLYGHFQCALPQVAFTEICEHAKKEHPEIKYVFLTGDYIHSGVWLYSKPENSRHIEAVTSTLTSTFPDVAIYPLVGNHEPDVVNMYAPQDLWSTFDLSWLYDVVSRPFLKQLGPDQLTTFKKGGYYTVKPEPGLRIVALNTNLCYLNNFWLPYAPVDPTGQLQWFADTMLQAEKDGDHVYIIGHISPGSGSCWTVWSAHFDRIVNRYQNLIRGQFYGHAHTEKFIISFDKTVQPPNPTTVSYVSPSALTDGMNSGYRIYQVDGARSAQSTWEILDYETWVLKTVESNAQMSPVWKQLYSAKDAYQLTSVRPKELFELVKLMVNDDEMFLKFQEHHNKGDDSTRGRCSADDPDLKNCKMGLLCDTVIYNSGDESMCDELRKL